MNTQPQPPNPDVRGLFGLFPQAEYLAYAELVSDEQVPAGETRTILVHIRADSPAQEQLTFAVREAEPGELSQ